MNTSSLTSTDTDDRMDATKVLDSALDLLQRLPPQQVTRNLHQIARLRQSDTSLHEDLETAVDQPLVTSLDPCSNRLYIQCEYNRESDSYRSPWCNQYHPPLSESGDGHGVNLSASLRQLEVNCNDAFSKYLDMYYDGGVSSVYFWQLDNHIAAAILFKKAGNNTNTPQHRRHTNNTQGSWDSIHVLEIKEHGRHKYRYIMTSSVMLWLQTSKHVSGLMNIGGSIVRQTERDIKIKRLPQSSAMTSSTALASPSLSTAHVINIGELVEEVENQMRAHLYEIYFWKTKDVVVRCLRSCVRSQHERRRNSRMLDTAGVSIRRTPSGKHLLVPAGDSVHV